jgi:DNA adenine methylase
MGDKRRKPEKLERAMPSTEPKAKMIDIKPRPKAVARKEDMRDVIRRKFMPEVQAEIDAKRKKGGMMAVSDDEGDGSGMTELAKLLQQLQMEGGAELRSPSLSVPFCRQGNKFYHRKDIVPIIPPHKRYVELFAGSGAIFYNKAKADDNILNDLDKGVVQRFNMIKNASTDFSKYNQSLDSLAKVRAYYDKPAKTKEDKLLHAIIQTCFGFSGKPVVKSTGIYKPGNPLDKLKRHLDDWKEALKDTKIENKDYAEVIKKYDSPDTFFFLDPPYENTDKDFEYAQDEDFDFERLANVLDGIKGNFLMTINDSPNIRKLFKKFQVKTWNVRAGWAGSRAKGHDNRRAELLISNYPQKKYP